MDIYILRHGEAEPGSRDVAEADRKLTPKGRRDVKAVSLAARAAKVEPDIILTSPYARALETAEIVRHTYPSKPRLQKTEALLPYRTAKQVWKEIRLHSRFRRLLLAGHEPQLSSLVAYLLAAPELRLDLKKGALVYIRMDRAQAEPRGELMWIITPRLARKH